ncbi:MAG: ECF-type sigma factor [Planctomycetota bacterium]
MASFRDPVDRTGPACPPEITRLIRAAAGGDPAAHDALCEAVYQELHRVARGTLRSDSPQLLQPTAIVHETWVKLQRHLERFDDRQHFFRTAARAMRQLLANHAEAARTAKRGGGRVQATTLSDVPAARSETYDALALHEALDKLAGLHRRHARVVELRFLCSLTIEQTAEALGISRSTVEADWSMARSWLRRELDAIENGVDRR